MNDSYTATHSSYCPGMQKCFLVESSLLRFNRHAGGARELLLLLDAEEKLRRQNDMAIKSMSRSAISNFVSSALVKLNSSRASDTAPAVHSNVSSINFTLSGEMDPSREDAV